MGCNQSFCSVNREEARLTTYGLNYYVVKKQQVEFNNKNEIFYKKTDQHNQIKNKIVPKRGSLKEGQKEYNNGNVKVIIF